MLAVVVTVLMAARMLHMVNVAVMPVVARSLMGCQVVVHAVVLVACLDMVVVVSVVVLDGAVVLTGHQTRLR